MTSNIDTDCTCVNLSMTAEDF